MMKREDLEITLHNPREKGGQHVGIEPYVIIVKHVPTGMYAACGRERSQHKNLEVAMSMIEWGLAQIGWVDT